MINWLKNLFQPKITIAEHYRLMDMQGDANKTELEKVRAFWTNSWIDENKDARKWRAQLERLKAANDKRHADAVKRREGNG